MTRNELIQSLEERLHCRAQELRGLVLCEVDRLRTLHEEAVGDIGDRGIEAHAADLTGKLAEAESLELAKIEAALERSHEGGFGFCIECDKRISMERLRSIPHS